MVKAAEFIPCTLRQLPIEATMAAAQRAVDINPSNRPLTDFIGLMKDVIETSAKKAKATPAAAPTGILAPGRLAVLTSKYWGAKGIHLTVAFMESTPVALRNKILEHMNAWNKTANVEFVYSTTSPQVRISRGGGGYWSYLGVDVLSIPANEPTMNLEGFTTSTPSAEYNRVVRHETGHTMGFPHEHMRPDLVALLDVQKTIAYFRRTQGWSAEDVRQQVLTPLNEKSIMGTPNADKTSIMCYQLPGEITKSGQPIVGGDVINDLDFAFAGKLYPKQVVPPPDPPPTGDSGLPDTFEGVLKFGEEEYRCVCTKKA